jgi:hypothetical protein
MDSTTTRGITVVYHAKEEIWGMNCERKKERSWVKKLKSVMHFPKLPTSTTIFASLGSQ